MHRASLSASIRKEEGEMGYQAGADNVLRLPDLGDVNEVTIIEWMKAEGDSFGMGDDILEVETEKTTFVVDAPCSGHIKRIVRKAGEKARLNDILAELD